MKYIDTDMLLKIEEKEEKCCAISSKMQKAMIESLHTLSFECSTSCKTVLCLRQAASICHILTVIGRFIYSRNRGLKNKMCCRETSFFKYDSPLEEFIASHATYHNTNYISARCQKTFTQSMAQTSKTFPNHWMARRYYLV